MKETSLHTLYQYSMAGLFCESTTDCPFGIFPIRKVDSFKLCSECHKYIQPNVTGTTLPVENFPKNEITYDDNFYFYHSQSLLSRFHIQTFHDECGVNYASINQKVQADLALKAGNRTLYKTVLETSHPIQLQQLLNRNRTVSDYMLHDILRDACILKFSTSSEAKNCLIDCPTPYIVEAGIFDTTLSSGIPLHMVAIYQYSNKVIPCPGANMYGRVLQEVRECLLTELMETVW